MQKFTRALTREIVLGEERLALTLDENGLSVRPVGSRKAPFTMDWADVMRAATGNSINANLGEVLQQLKAGAAGNPKKVERTSEPAAEVATPLESLLPRIDAWVAQYRSRFLPAMLPGATPAEMVRLEELLGRPLPQELHTWQTWHNGQSDSIPGAFVLSWHLMSAEEIANTKAGLDGQENPGWNKAWIPFLDDNQGNYVCLDIATPHHPVREVWRGKSDQDVVAASLTSWATDLVNALEGGMFVEDEERGELLRVC
jgi:cell wall assembly regulator SMI1